jgi:hypothetical protein
VSEIAGVRAITTHDIDHDAVRSKRAFDFRRVSDVEFVEGSTLDELHAGVEGAILDQITRDMDADCDSAT